MVETGSAFTKFDWQVGPSAPDVTIATGLIKTTREWAQRSIPFLADLLPFRDSWNSTHLITDEWLAVRVQEVHSTGIPSSGPLDSKFAAPLTDLMSRTSSPSYDEIKSIVPYGFCEFFYAGPYRDGHLSWAHFRQIWTGWMNCEVLPEVQERNRQRMRLAGVHVPTPSAGGQRVFLSHKGTDKPLVRELYDVLRLLGFDPWLDEVDMPAGTELHRGIQAGIEDSCAVVFLISPSFVDERHLHNEINYAVARKTNLGDRFAIVTVAIEGASDNIPVLLKPYVWCNATSQLDALRAVLRALPLEVGPVRERPAKP